MDPARNNSYPSNHSIPFQPRCTGRFTGTSEQWYLMTAALLSIENTGALCNLINLLVFRRWKSKQPFLYFHVSLSIAETLYLVFMSVPSWARIADPFYSQQWPYIFGITDSYLGAMLYNAHIVCISLDRWISVDFSIFYRNRVTERVIRGVIVCMWGYCVVFAVTLFAILHPYIVVPCNSVAYFAYPKLWYSLYVEGTLILAIVVVGLTQSRLIYVAIRAKIRMFQHRKVQHTSTTHGHRFAITFKESWTLLLMSLLSGHHSVDRTPANDEATTHSVSHHPETRDGTKKLLKVMGKTVLTGSVIVITAILCQIPTAILRWTNQSQSKAYAYFILLFYGQHIIPIFAYFAFYPHYRTAVKAVFKGCRS